MVTLHQERVLEKCLNILSNSNRLLLKGSAGTGKTYLLDYLIGMLNLTNKKEIEATAPTNKAVAVLKEKISKRNNLSFSTTHSALRLKRVINYKTGEISFKPDRYAKKKDIDILIIDEASMLNTEIVEFLEKEFKYKTIIFVGDDKQINPVKEENSPVFNQGYPEAELTEIVRQGKDNPIIFLSQNLKKINEKESNGDEESGYIYTNDLNKIIRSLAKVNGTNELKYIAWTNNEVNRINNLVRQTIYDNPRKIELKETLIFDKPYIFNKDKFYTNQEVKVMSLEVGGERDLKYYYVNNSFKVLHEDSEKTFKRIKNSLLKKAKNGKGSWKGYYDFIEKYAMIKYNHALTVHKSQGSTYDKTIINLGDIMKNRNIPERNRLLYTAVTRAKDLLIIYN